MRALLPAFLLCIDLFGIYAIVRDVESLGATMNAVPDLDFDHRWIALIKLKFGIGSPCVKHALIFCDHLAFFVVCTQEFGDLSETVGVDRVVCDFHDVILSRNRGAAPAVDSMCCPYELLYAHLSVM